MRQAPACFTQLTFAGPLAHQLVGKTTLPPLAPVVEHDGHAASLSAFDPVTSAQTMLLSVPRDWRAVHSVPHGMMPPLSAEAGALLEQFTVCLPATAGGQRIHANSIRLLHRLLAYTGMAQPIAERDVRTLAALGPKVSLHRIVFSLHERGLFEPDQQRTTAAAPCWAAWTGPARTPGTARPSKTSSGGFPTPSPARCGRGLPSAVGKAADPTRPPTTRASGAT
ncbi:hypothetical protein ABZ743_32850 [Streptomyces sp. NPDC006662]|uniref:hypothetical protein n=1 Tax=Streptomyces sp. NPDC006662 TaxID=3156902 RepID=UPI0033FB110B